MPETKRKESMRVMPLSTERLYLEPLGKLDLPMIFEIARNKESIEDYQYVATTITDVETWLMPGIEDSTVLLWTIQKQQQVIGLFEVCLEAEYSDVSEHIARLGYFLDVNYQNQGYMTEVMQAILHWLFSATDIQRVEAGVTLHNVPSYRILEKVGFTREKVVEKNWKWYGELYDSAYYYICSVR